MPTLKKVQILSIAFFWLFVTVFVVCVGFPIGALAVFFGGLLSLVHINFVADFAECILRAMTSYVRSVTKRLRKLVREAEAYEKEHDKE